MDGFYQLFTRFLQQQSERPLDWDKIKNLGPDKVGVACQLCLTASLMHGLFLYYVIGCALQYLEACFADGKGTVQAAHRDGSA